jgi:hypothetical protein
MRAVVCKCITNCAACDAHASAPLQKRIIDLHLQDVSEVFKPDIIHLNAYHRSESVVFSVACAIPSTHHLCCYTAQALTHESDAFYDEQLSRLVLACIYVKQQTKVRKEIAYISCSTHIEINLKKLPGNPVARTYVKVS